MPLAAVAALGAVGSVAGGLIGASGASHAADTQAAAAEQAAQLQAQTANNALANQVATTNLQTRLGYPYLLGGYGMEANLAYLLGINPSTLGSVPATAPQLGGAGGYGGYGTTGGVPGVAGPGQPGYQPPLVLNPNVAGGGALEQNPNAVWGTQPDFSAAPPPESPPNSGQAIPWNAPRQMLPAGGGNMGPVSPPGTGINWFSGGRGLGASMATGANPAAPATGTGAGTIPLSSMVNPGLQFGELTQKYPGGEFQSPTNVTEQNDPGFQFRLQEGQRALEGSAAARGNVLTGRTAADLNAWAQNYASNEYGNVYNRALTNYATNYGTWQDRIRNLYSMYSGGAIQGQNALSGISGVLGQGANNATNILLTSGNQQAQALNNAAAARASGYVGGANAIAGGISGLTGSLGNMILLNQLFQNQGNTGGGTTLPGFAGMV